MRVTAGGAPVAFFDVDMTSAYVFPQIVAPLPGGDPMGGGRNGLWVANNRCNGDACRVTGYVAQEYRQVCTGGGGESGDMQCTTERPFLEIYGACPAGTQRGDRIGHTTGAAGDAGDVQTTYLEEGRCYAPSEDPEDAPGEDITRTLQGSYWRPAGSRPVVGFRLNPLYGYIPQMTLGYERPHTTVIETDQWDDQCPALDAEGRCAVTGAARCVDGPATKEIDGAPVTRSCWRYETSLSCQYGAPTDECAPLATAGCTPTGTTCRQPNPATGLCEITENTYSCPVAPGSAVTARNCPKDVFCIAGSCFNTTYTNDADFARAMSFLEAGREAGVYRREGLAPGDRVRGPALIIEANQTIVVEPGWTARLTAADHVVLSRHEKMARAHAVGTQQADPILLEVFNNLFMNIAEQMGVALQNTAHSVNIKERLDFSCAVFDRTGALVANAPHMPVHLGSMDRSVETIIRLNAGDVSPGDVFALNAPYNGGTHLPDITVVSPVFDDAGKEILFWVASRGHHADIGGTAPGSMTPLATTVDEEGVLIDNFRLVERGTFREKELHELLTNHPWPARNPAQNIADLKAQIAANERGAAELRRMVEEFGLDVVHAYMGHVQDNAAEEVARLVGRLDDCEYEYPTDTGQVIRVKITVDREARTATVDFTGTSDAIGNNFNAPEPVARAAVLYCFRVMVEAPIPMNAGCLRPIRIVIPDGSMLKPAYPRAVVAGNVETSQHVTNAIFGALGAIANSQGTMNNLTFGNDEYQYYETICSGSPAGRMNDGTGFAGTSGVHVHMTNSRLTDPEILEMRFPVVVENFALRPGSGGKGAFSAGDGTTRTLRFLKKMDCAILSSHRSVVPRGIAGGGDGECGRTGVRRLDGRIEVLKGCDQTTLEAGEAVTVITPTAGGYGRA